MKGSASAPSSAAIGTLEAINPAIECGKAARDCREHLAAARAAAICAGVPRIGALARLDLDVLADNPETLALAELGDGTTLASKPSSERPCRAVDTRM